MSGAPFGFFATSLRPPPLFEFPRVAVGTVSGCNNRDHNWATAIGGFHNEIDRNVGHDAALLVIDGLGLFGGGQGDRTFAVGSRQQSLTVLCIDREKGGPSLAEREMTRPELMWPRLSPRLLATATHHIIRPPAESPVRWRIG